MPATLPRYIDRFHRRNAILRRYTFTTLGRFTSRLAIESGGLRYYVSTQDLVGRELYVTGHFEREILAAGLSILAERSGRTIAGKLFVDIGANIGTTVIPAVRTYGASSAVAFEPESANVKLLRQNLIENDAEDRVQVIPVALSDVNADGVLELATTNWGDHRIRRASPEPGGRFGESVRRTVCVPLRRFDDVCTELGLGIADVGLVWMDVQGHEAQVLTGAPSLVTSDVPVLTEYWPYGLHRSDSLHTMHDLITSNYREVVDIRASVDAGALVSVPANDIAGLETKYVEQFTDLLLLK
jgi:FkbM family methyltransferase